MPSSDATTVHFPDNFGSPETALVTDGPFVESKEVIGGFWVVDVEDLDEALRMAEGMAWQQDGRDTARPRDDALGESLDALAVVFREEAGKVTGALVRVLGDFALAEESVQDAIVAALEHWPSEGVPDRPGAWLFNRRAAARPRRASP